MVQRTLLSIYDSFQCYFNPFSQDYWTAVHRLRHELILGDSTTQLIM